MNGRTTQENGRLGSNMTSRNNRKRKKMTDMKTPAELYYVTFKGQQAMLYNSYKQIIRKFNVDSEIVNAQVSGNGKDTYVAIVTKDGRSYLYRSDGVLVRR